MNPFRKSSKQVSIFITAGYPNIDSLPEQIAFLEKNGVDFIEVGIPFSDPMADGPTIQESSDIALRNGMSVSLLFEQLRSVQSNVPLVIMSYFNPIMHFGLDRFLAHCQQAAISHLIIPDIGLEVYEKLYQSKFEAYGITLCFLITPKTDSDRITKMSSYAQNGFIYLVSSSMTTGNDSKTNGLSPLEMERIRKVTGTTPLMIGFGIRSKEDVENVHQIADGAIIGSAYIRAIQRNEKEVFVQSLTAEAPIA